MISGDTYLVGLFFAFCEGLLAGALLVALLFTIFFMDNERDD